MPVSKQEQVVECLYAMVATGTTGDTGNCIRSSHDHVPGRQEIRHS